MPLFQDFLWGTSEFKVTSKKLWKSWDLTWFLKLEIVCEIWCQYKVKATAINFKAYVSHIKTEFAHSGNNVENFK